MPERPEKIQRCRAENKALTISYQRLKVAKYCFHKSAVYSSNYNSTAKWRAMIYSMSLEI